MNILAVLTPLFRRYVDKTSIVRLNYIFKLEKQNGFY